MCYERGEMIMITQEKVVPVELELLQRLSKDLKQASTNLGKAEARCLVDLYYQMQDFRIATAGQVRSIVKGDNTEPCETIKFFEKGFSQLEEDIKKVLDIYTDNNPVGKWCKSIVGIGPVISAGLIANLDISDKPTAGHFWSYCGQNDQNRPWLGKEKTKVIVDSILNGKKNKDITYEDFALCCLKTQWNPDNIENAKDGKGNYIFKKDDKYTFRKEDIIKQLSKRPYNNKMKVLCWKIGESFIKVQNSPNDFYGKLYQKRKAFETLNNEKLEYKEQAAECLKKFNKATESYKYYMEGKLPPAQIHARARRYAIKIFLSHLHKVMYMVEYGQEPPKPFPIAILGHAHEIECPNLEILKEFV